jgi:TonB family protein
MRSERRLSMKTRTKLISLLALTLVATAAAQPAPTTRLPSFERLRLKNQEVPLYPFDLVQTGVREGQVCIAFSVDVAGNVDDGLAVAYTHPEFARVALAAVRRWTFEPARLAGQPIATATEVTFNFEVQGTVVVSLTAGEAFTAWVNSLHRVNESFFPRTLRELDRIPTPLSAPAPAYPSTLARSGHVGDVIVNFYIDETGAVRLPAVDSGNDPELAALAIVAIQHWKFEPPVCRGQKVLTKTSQVFRFRPATTPVASAGGKN